MHIVNRLVGTLVFSLTQGGAPRRTSLSPHSTTLRAMLVIFNIHPNT